MKHRFEVALSFAGEDRQFAEAVASGLRAAGVKVFYDDFYLGELWGEDLSEKLEQRYFHDSQYCIMVISEHYLQKMWTVLERRHIIARMIEERHAYALPVRLDDFQGEVPGLPSTIGYIRVRSDEPEVVVDRFLERIGFKDKKISTTQPMGHSGKPPLPSIKRKFTNIGKEKFIREALTPQSEKWEKCVQRLSDLYNRQDDIRSPFARDYNRILHCTAYRRLKHKTQVFFATSNDHICTRMEHVTHVAAVSYSIAKHLGLNTELTDAIAIGHDLGHAPFGHAGEDFLKQLIKKELGESFWHEKNSLRFVDKCETLEDPQGNHQNLNLTYAVRDGIICHCGEVDENHLFPRSELKDLETIMRPSEFSPYTWEGCVVKIADKISYLGRDLEDARTLDLFNRSQWKMLIKAIRPFTKTKLSELNNTLIMHEFIIDLCSNSSPEGGIHLSEDTLELMNTIKSYSKENIYNHWKIQNYKEYVGLIIRSIYEMLMRLYRQEDTLVEIDLYAKVYPLLTKVFSEWLAKYTDIPYKRSPRYRNLALYDLRQESDYPLCQHS